MPVNRWHTKKDVLYDLAKFTGSCTSDLDDNYVVVGERPPPCLMSVEDEEITLRYGKIEPTANINENDKPDVHGIIQMLRLVKNKYEDSVAVDQEVPPEQPQERIRISKLNPNVQEFIPKSVASINNECAPKQAVSDTLTVDIKLDDESDSDKSKDIDSRANKDGLTQSTAELKNNISNSPKDLKGKRERTLAIVTLLKMHSAANPIELPKLKLLPPEYFETSENDVNKIKSEINVDVIHKEKQPTFDSVDSSNTMSTPSSSQSPVVNNNLDRVSPSYLESVNKVNDWLDGVSPSNTKSIDKVNNGVNGSVSPKLPKPKPSLHLGPITFKKKNKPIKLEEAKQTSTDTTDSKSTQSLISSPKQAEMSESEKEKYIKRNEAYQAKIEQEKLDRMNFWENLEYRLKQIDKKIIEKQLKKESES